MDLYHFAFNITAYANLIANKLNEEDLELAAASFSQLGDTLATICVLRSRCQGDDENSES